MVPVDMRSMMDVDGLSLFTCHMHPRTLEGGAWNAQLAVLLSSATCAVGACAAASTSGYTGIALRAAG